MEIDLQGPVGRLVAQLDEPEGQPRGVAIVCHPHPLHGGSLRNTIVVRTARALRSLGFATLRFNFRGVEGSAGAHDGAAEVEDAAAAAGWLQTRHPGLPLWAAGYSFGSRVVSELALREVGVERVFLIAFPCRLYSPALLEHLRVPGLILLGELDEFGTAADLARGLPRRPPGLSLVEIPGADHFFRGRTPLVEAAVLDHAQRALLP
ncbi:MAG: alpha/beta family hydrolase [Planctomycetota bacterium]